MTATRLPDFQGHRLRQAREVREVTASALAERIGVSGGTVSNWEGGRVQPRAGARLHLSEALELPTAFFLRPPSSSAPVHFRFRSMSAATKRARLAAQGRAQWLHEIVEFLGDVLELPRVNVPEFDLPSDPRVLTDDMIEDLAEQTRAFWGLRDGPLPNVVGLLETKGIAVARLALNVAKLDGLSGWSTNGRPYVILNAEKASCVRSRFDAAHELGHLVLHRRAPIRPDSALHKLMETQAHKFAGAFLFPRTAVEDEVGQASLDSLARLKERWRLSIRAQIFRLFALDLITEHQKYHLQRSLGARGWRTWEPLDDELHPESPSMIRQAYELLCNQAGWTPEDIKRAVPIANYDHERLANLPSRWMEGARHQQTGTLVELRQNEVSPAASDGSRQDGKVIAFPGVRR